MKTFFIYSIFSFFCLMTSLAQVETLDTIIITRPKLNITSNDIHYSKIEAPVIKFISPEDSQAVIHQNIVMPKKTNEINHQDSYLTLEQLLVTDLNSLSIDENSKKALREILNERNVIISNGLSTDEIDDKIKKSLNKCKIKNN